MAKQTQKGKTKEAAEVGASTVQVPREQQVREAILEKYKQVESGYIELAKLLSEAYHKEYYAKWGFKDFREYTGTEIGVDYRKALYLVDIWDKVKSLNLSPAKVEALGWTKMKDMAAILTAENAKEWMDKAKNMTSREVSEAVKLVRSPDRSAGGATVPQITTMTLRMGDSEARIILEALDEAKKLTNSDNAVVAMEMICQDWLEMKGVSPERTSLEDHVAYLNAAYGVDITWKTSTKKDEAEAEDEKAAVVEEKAEKKAASRKKKGKAAPAPEEDAPKSEQNINALLGLE